MLSDNTYCILQSYWTQIKLNLWKSWLVRKRKPVSPTQLYVRLTVLNLKKNTRADNMDIKWFIQYYVFLGHNWFKIKGTLSGSFTNKKTGSQTRNRLPPSLRICVFSYTSLIYNVLTVTKISSRFSWPLRFSGPSSLSLLSVCFSGGLHRLTYLHVSC